MSAGEHRRPTILFATIAAGGGHVAGAWAMAESVERHYPGRFELRVSDYMKDLGSPGSTAFTRTPGGARCATRSWPGSASAS